MTGNDFPPNEGWCVEITHGDPPVTVGQRVLTLAEDAREYAKEHAWRNKGDVARVFERRGGETVFETRITYPT